MEKLNPIAKSKRNPSSLRLAINAHCYMCMGGEEIDLRTRKTSQSGIRACASTNCPLWPVRRVNARNEQVNKSTWS